MILSHKYKFIFLKTNKTAGTSIEIALSRFCGPEDIITPISAPDEEIRRQLGYPGSQNYLARLERYRGRDFLKFLIKKRTRKLKRRFYNHIPAHKVRARVGEDVWNSYYKFCFERNPWDRMLSMYYWRSRKRTTPLTFSEFIASDIPAVLKKKGLGVYTIDGEVAVDKVCLYERLEDDLEDVRQRIGLPEKLVLPKTKSGIRQDKRSYREVLTEEQRDRIAEMFNDEIKLLGYEF